MSPNDLTTLPALKARVDIVTEGAEGAGGTGSLSRRTLRSRFFRSGDCGESGFCCPQANICARETTSNALRNAVSITIRA